MNEIGVGCGKKKLISRGVGGGATKSLLGSKM